MRFAHDRAVRAEFPALVAGVLVTDVREDAPVDTARLAEWVDRFLTTARGRIAGRTESALPEIQAWRRAFAQMGLKPTQYRCAAESLLRRFRKEDALPHVHPLVDLGNAASVAFAIPVAVLDLDRVAGDLVVRPATGSEDYETFSGDHEHPQPGEIVFVDSAGHAHARRWTNRQSGRSSVTAATRQAFVVVEALHDTAGEDVPRLLAVLADAVSTVWAPVRMTALLTTAEPIVDVPSPGEQTFDLTASGG